MAIVVRKAGDIIPEVVRVAKQENPKATPFQLTACPVCGAKLVRETEDGADLYCSNVSCPAKRTQRIIFFASKDCMDIKGLGERIIEDLVESKFVEVPSDLYKLHEEEAELSDMFGAKTIKNLFAAIERSKAMSADRVLKALGWRNIGAHAGKTLLKEYGSIPNLFAAYEKEDAALYEHLLTLDGFGDTLCKAVMSLIRDEEMKKEISLLEQYGVNMAYQGSAGSTLEGLTFVITGTLPTLGRKEAQALIEQNGGKVSGSVSKKTNYLLAGEAAGSKLKKAQDLGVAIISEDELRDMLG